MTTTNAAIDPETSFYILSNATARERGIEVPRIFASSMFFLVQDDAILAWGTEAEVRDIARGL